MSDVKTLIQDSVAQHQAILETLRQTDYAPPAREQHKRFLQELKRDLDRSTNNLASLDRKRQAELKDHETYSNSHFRRFLFKATGQSTKFVEKASKEEREYFDVLQQLHEEEKVNASLAARVAEAEATLQELSNAADINSHAQQQLDELYLSIFSGPTPQFPGDDEREARSNQTLQAFHETQMRAEAEAQVVKLLTAAVHSMKAALAAMEDALSASRMDMFGGGTMTDMMERNALSQAERSVHQAQVHAMQAQRVSPLVGAFPRIKHVEVSFFGDVLFDNIFSDMAMHERLKDGRMEFQKASVWVHDQLQRARERQREAGQELQGRQADLEAARSDLQKFREDVFVRVAKGELSK